MFGTIPGLRKSEYHKIAPKPTNFAEIIVDIYALTKPQVEYCRWSNGDARYGACRR